MSKEFYRVTSIEEGKLNPEKVLSLDLSNKSIHNIDLDILLFSNLEELILDGNKDILSLPEELEYLLQLESLSIRGCNYLLLNTLDVIEELKVLDCSEMDLRYVYGEESRVMCLGKYNKLKELHIDGAKLHELPACISNLKELEILTLDNNLLETLPKEIFMLNNLKLLSVRNNKLNSLGNIVELAKLETFLASGNKLRNEKDKIKKKLLINSAFKTDIYDCEKESSAIRKEVLDSKVLEKLARIGVEKIKEVTEEKYIKLFYEAENDTEVRIPVPLVQFLWGYDWNKIALEWTNEEVETMDENITDDDKVVSISTDYYMNESIYIKGIPYIAIGAYEMFCHRTLLICLEDSNISNPMVYEFSEELSEIIALSEFLQKLQKKD